MSNIGFHKALKEMGCKTEITAVGDRYVLEKMRKDGYSLGGEQSGHIIFLDYNTTGDGLLTAVQLLSIMKQQNKPLSELAALMTRYPQILKNVRVQTKSGWEDNNLIMPLFRPVKKNWAMKVAFLSARRGQNPSSVSWQKDRTWYNWNESSMISPLSSNTKWALRSKY